MICWYHKTCFSSSISDVRRQCSSDLKSDKTNIVLQANFTSLTFHVKMSSWHMMFYTLLLFYFKRNVKLLSRFKLSLYKQTKNTQKKTSNKWQCDNTNKTAMNALYQIFSLSVIITVRNSKQTPWQNHYTT